MARPWQLWLIANGTAALLGLATGWFDVSIQGTLVACGVTAVFMPLMGGYEMEVAHG